MDSFDAGHPPPLRGKAGMAQTETERRGSAGPRGSASKLRAPVRGPPEARRLLTDSVYCATHNGQHQHAIDSGASVEPERPLP